MPTFRMLPPDVVEANLGFALLLFDRFTHSQRLLGQTTVRLKDKPVVKQFMPFAKTTEATYLFFGLPPGAYIVEILNNLQTSDGRPEYYLPAEIPISIPMPDSLWPAFPDITLADQSKLPDDPAQPPAYRAQRQAATLQPSISYPFPTDATLVRGIVLAGGAPLLNAVVSDADPNNLQTGKYQTGSDGQFVLFFENVAAAGETIITLLATHEAHPDQKTDVKVTRGTTAVTNIEMAP